MAGTPAAYASDQQDFHAWITVGNITGVSTVNNPIVTDLQRIEDAYNPIMSAAEMTLLLQALSTNPYEDIEPYDPEADAHGPASLLGFIDEQLSYIEDQDADIAFVRHAQTVADTFDEHYDSGMIDDAVNAFENKLETKTAQQIAKLNELYSDANMLNSTGRAIAIGLIERGETQEVASHRSQLELAVQEKRLIGVVELPVKIMQIDTAAIPSRAAFAEMFMKGIELNMTSKRQFVEDTIRFDTDDTLWDAKVLQFSEEALNSISGSKIIPAQPSPAVQIIGAVSGATSAAAGIAGSIMGPLSMAFGIGG